MFKNSFKRRVSVALATLMLCSCRSKGGDGIFKRGAYTGVSANGRNGEVKVEVVLSADKIESVTVGENSETAGIADPAIEKIPERIVETQSLDVDTVAGATITSNAILEAVSDAITQAGADPTKLVANTGDKEVDAVLNEVERIERSNNDEYIPRPKRKRGRPRKITVETDS